MRRTIEEICRSDWGPRLNPEHLRHCLVELTRRLILCVLPLISLLPRQVDEGDADGEQVLREDIERLQAVRARLLGGAAGPGPEVPAAQ